MQNIENNHMNEEITLKANCKRMSYWFWQMEFISNDTLSFQHIPFNIWQVN